MKILHESVDCEFSTSPHGDYAPGWPLETACFQLVAVEKITRDRSENSLRVTGENAEVVSMKTCAITAAKKFPNWPKQH